MGRTGLLVSRLCFGTLTSSPLQADFSPEKAAALLVRAHERGVNVLDTAAYYQNYTHIRAAGRAIDSMRIITKCHAHDREGAAQRLREALRETGRTRIDVMMLHEQESEWTLRGHAQALAYFFEQRDAGVLGAVGVSTHFVRCALAAARMADIDVIEGICNARGVGIPDGGQEAMNEALALAHQNGKGVVAMKALEGGHRRADVAQALSEVMALPFVDTVAVGMQSADEIDFNVSVFEGNPCDEIAARIGQQPRRLHIADWCTGCGNCAARCQARALTLDNGKMTVQAGRCVLCGYCAAACEEFCIKVY